ncbi:NAD-dependent epimerase/dehydratase family protein [Sorangium sp. So ce375]|uniref:NAD-dependent epimerase/dehydratase family protein n=1 Tax=Sorangium sp. So ce375 TaxID=3133306 RepID=UPI003F5C4BC8
MRETRIAVVGAGGFIGSHLVPALLERFACQVDAVDVDLTKLECWDARVRRIEARVEAPGLVEDVTERCQVVISLTALCNPAQYSTIPLEVIDASFTHLLPLVKRCAERAVRLIHFSTAEVYGRTALDAQGLPSARMHEDDSCFLLGPVGRERWTYSCAKQLLERVIWAHGQHGALPFTIIRPFNTIGARMDFLPGIDGEGTPRVLASFMSALLRGEPLPLVGGGAQRRAFMDVSDMVEAVCRVLERPNQSRGQIFNIGNPDNNVSIAELARLLADAFAERLPERAPAQFRAVSAAEFYGPGYDDTQERIPDVQKAQQLLGWKPQRRLATSLPPIVHDYVERYGGRVAAACSLSQLASSA